MLLRTLTIENFRSFRKIVVELDAATILIGENNTGKTSFLEAIQLALTRNPSRRANIFDDYDFHLADAAGRPGDAGPISLTLDFAEAAEGDWQTDVRRDLSDIIVYDGGNCGHVILRIRCSRATERSESELDWAFLDAAGNPLSVDRQKTANLFKLQNLVPVFYLSALRDAAREFQSRGRYWSPFLRDAPIESGIRADLEQQLTELNAKVVQAHEPLRDVRDYLLKAQGIVELASTEPVTIDALPGRVFDMLSRAQVNIASKTGAKLPLGRHGAGTQSLSVILLFQAFASSMLKKDYDENSEPLLALEEPEAHLHPSAVRALASSLLALPGQKVVATHSGDLLSAVPLTSIRRFCRKKGDLRVGQIRPGILSPEDERKLNYHVRMSRGELLFARCWLLVEGETEYVILRNTADLLGFDLDMAGVRIVSFTAAGIEPFLKAAGALEIEWFCLTDSDQAGQNYRRTVVRNLGTRPEKEHLASLPEVNMEVFLAANGFGSIFENHVSEQKRKNLLKKPGQKDYWENVVQCVGDKAKPSIALEVANAMRQTGRQAVPAFLEGVLASSLTLAQR
jgi:putative ATP-dependent endonuclease of OLD family